MLHRDVSLFVAQGLVRQIDAGTPWLARGAAALVAELDMSAWTALGGLMEECPVMPAAVTAILEASTASVSATAFDFISTRAQIGDVRIFMRMLPSLLRP